MKNRRRIRYSPWTLGKNFRHVFLLEMFFTVYCTCRSESPLELVYGNAQEPDEEVLPAYPALKPGLPSDGRLSPNFRLMAHVPMRSTPADPPFGSLAEQVTIRRLISRLGS